MFIYSKKINRFISEIKNFVTYVLSREAGLKVGNGYFFDQRMERIYPINIVLYNDRKMLGYFDPEFFEIGFHECLMRAAKKNLHDLIRHELAHYLVHIIYGNSVQVHGNEFRNFCKLKGWGEEVYKATTILEEGEEDHYQSENSILRKVKKLMALTSSSNRHEAELAMIKSQQLLLKHNIEGDSIDCNAEENIIMQRVIKQKRKNDKMRAIGMILGTFFVSVVFNRSKEFTYLEIVGNAINVEIAEYVAAFLDLELDKLWKQGQKQANLRGVIAKNSFFLGIARGYCNKVKELERGYESSISNALMVIEKQLVEAAKMVYGRLSKAKSGGSHCPHSSALGEQLGRGLHINPAITRTSKVLTLLLK
ncbi:MAG: DUF2786 domain-containing protein [Candidatus Protochlamydia sp.]|nr:DUF2786 domain-containing protein [Candidatus Protochlamydia sp.]